ncbi:hypothetical protein H5410_046465 [Solanum commersonii]|uniref:Uncharacterized protein n=1 Tax=Solanum commersonii TaxID=4109 RepID=A0A9J5XEI2_SOLCO|nr:hypothetical protein H5410_046465 [Solanum commersonii]
MAIECHTTSHAYMYIRKGIIASSYFGCHNLSKDQSQDFWLTLESFKAKRARKHGHYVTKRNEKAEKNKELRISNFTWRVAEGSYFAFCYSVLSLEGKDQVGEKREQLAHRREVP